MRHEAESSFILFAYFIPKTSQYLTLGAMSLVIEDLPVEDLPVEEKLRESKRKRKLLQQHAAIHAEKY